MGESFVVVYILFMEFVGGGVKDLGGEFRVRSTRSMVKMWVA